MKNIIITLALLLIATIVIGWVYISKEKGINSWKYKDFVVQLKKINKEKETIEKNLKTFDELDFDIFTNEKWDHLNESHAEDIIVNWPDGHKTVWIDKHISDLKKLFVFAPDTRILTHPIRLWSWNHTAVMWVMEGTFTKPMPIWWGKFIEPTWKSFKLPMATIWIWENWVMIEEFLFWDNKTYYDQLGL